jgi:hypothetical protein
MVVCVVAGWPDGFISEQAMVGGPVGYESTTRISTVPGPVTTKTTTRAASRIQLAEQLLVLA